MEKQIESKLYRPGYFGKRRDAIIKDLNTKYASWDLRWFVGDQSFDFLHACHSLYGESYLRYFLGHPDEVDYICEFQECIDNADTNVLSGCDYMKQEASSTHIQDIAVRNALAILGRKFTGEREELLVIRSADSKGYKWGPGNIPFIYPQVIEQPSKCPKWANFGSVEDFWQSNKWVVTFLEQGQDDTAR